MRKHIKVVTVRKYLNVIITVTLLAVPAQVQAAADSGSLQYSYWTEDAIRIEERQTEEDTVFSLSAEQMKQDYGYVAIKGSLQGILNGNGTEEVSFNGVSIPYIIDTKSPFFMSFELEDKNNNKISINKNAVFGKISENKMYCYQFEEGQFKVNEPSSGSFFLPFTAFGENEKFQWNQLSAYTISLVIPKNNIVTFKIGDVKEITMEEDIFKQQNIPVLTGPSELEIPVNGESIGTYQIGENNFDIILSNDVDGVHFQDGILTINKEAENGIISLEASDTEGITMIKEVKIKDALRNTVEYLPSFPSPEEVEPISVPFEVLTGKAVIIFMLTASGCLAAIITAAYFFHYYKAMKEQWEGI